MKKTAILLLLGSLVFTTLSFSPFASAQISGSFSDIESDHQYVEAIYTLAGEGILIGYEDGSFKPDQEVTRTELLKIALMYLYDQDAVSSSQLTGCFDDVKGHWGENIICFAAEKGVVQGDGEDGLYNPSYSLFDPNRSVNFIEMAKIVTYIEDSQDFYTSVPWYEKSVTNLENLKAIPPSVTMLDQYVSRSEASEILYRYLNKIEPHQSFNTFDANQNSDTWEYLSDFNSLKKDVIFDEEFEIIDYDYTGDMRQVDDEECGDSCPWRDDNNIYFNSTVLSDIDFDELDFLTSEIAVDLENVYYFSGYGYAGILEGVDVETLEIPENYMIYYETIPNDIYDPLPFLGVYHIKDLNNSYLLLNSDLFDGKGNLWREALSIENPDLEFARVADKFATLIIPNANDEEVEFDGKHHFKVGDKAYYLNREIEGADIDTFGVYTGIEHFDWHQAFSYDENNLYYKGGLIEDADPGTFAVVKDSSWYYQDKNYVYSYDGKILEGLNVETFEIINYGSIAKDEDQVFVYAELVEGADPETFVYDSICPYDHDSYFLRENIKDNFYSNTLIEVTEEEWLESCSIGI